jgi:hypothetical protein
MLNDDETNPPPTLEESYSTAISSSNLKFDLDRPGAVQLIIHAGISPHTLGSALMRLRTEWDSVSKPVPATVAQLRALAATFPREGSGLVKVEARPPIGADGKPAPPQFVTPMVAAQRQADDWHALELLNLMQRLKTLDSVRDSLNKWAYAEGIENAPHVVAAVLMWWLNSTCTECKGAKNKVVPGTGRTSAKLCTKCKGTGELKVPHGFLGRKVLGYMNSCRHAASAHLRSMKWRHTPTTT